MAGSFLKLLLIITIFQLAGLAVSAQTDASSGSPYDNGKRGDDGPKTKTIEEMLFKQRLLKEKKDHDELLKRGDEALFLSKQLENAFEQNNTISSQDKQKLLELERLVVKIRKELGGEDADDDEEDVSASPQETKPSTLKEAFLYLQSTTGKLVDELKKTSRFSISAAAIQSSNKVLKLVRFLRIRR